MFKTHAGDEAMSAAALAVTVSQSLGSTSEFVAGVSEVLGYCIEMAKYVLGRHFGSGFEVSQIVLGVRSHLMCIPAWVNASLHGSMHPALTRVACETGFFLSLQRTPKLFLPPRTPR